MKNIKYLLFSLLCMICSCVVFAANEVVIKSITPIFDEESAIVVNEDNSVVFNDKDQSVEYKVILENTTDKDLPIESITLSKPSEDFLIYELEGLKNGDVLKAKGTHEVIVSLSTVKKDGSGRNFNDELTANISFSDSVVNPNTSAQELIVLFVSITFITGIVTICLKSKKVSRYVVLVVMFGSLMSVTSAKDSIILPIKLNVSFESQNVMKASACYEDEGPHGCVDFWEYNYQIINIYIQNEFDDNLDYEYVFDVSENGDGKVIAYLVENGVGDYFTYYDLHLQADGIIYANEDASYYFGWMQLESLNNLQGLDMLYVKNMDYMFISTQFNFDGDVILEFSNTSNVTSMSNMFNHASSLSKNSILDLSYLNTSSVTDMTGMFSSTGYYNAFVGLNLSGFDTSNVITMNGMFDTLYSEFIDYELDLSNFDTSNVTDMSNMFAHAFYGCKSLTLDISSFDTSKVSNMTQMFDNMASHSESVDFDVSGFDTSNVTSMHGMFRETARNSEIFSLDISNFDTSKVESFVQMFLETGYSNPNFELDISNFDTSSAVDMYGMFDSTGYSNPNFTLDVSNFDTSNVTDMSYMFDNAGYNSTVFTLDVSNFNTSNVTNMSYMFRNTGFNSKNFTLDLSSFDTSKVTEMEYMFSQTGYSNSNFILDVSNFDTSKVTDMDGMFYQTGYNSTKFSLDVSNFDTRNVTDMDYMFYETGYNSTNFNTTFTIKNVLKYTSCYNYMFFGVATKGNSKITVNYTSTNSSYINNYIATKSTNSNVFKGVQVD